MIGSEFCQWSRTICQLMVLVGMGIFVFTRKMGENRRPSHRFGGKVMRNTCLSLEPSYIPVKLRRDILERDNYKCFWCRKPENHDVGHLWLKCLGGDTSFWNVVTQCETCKRKKHYKSPSEFISELKVEEIDIFREMEMVIKVIKRNGEEIKGEVDSRPDPNAKGFYISYFGDGTQQFISWQDVKDLFILSGRDKLPDSLPYSRKENGEGRRGKEEK